MNKLIVVLAILFLSSMTALAQDNRGNYGTESGNMGGGSYGSGMMGGQGYGTNKGNMMQGYNQSPECQKFYTETTELRKELHLKRFEYDETQRDPKATGETTTKQEKEIQELQEKISAKAPSGCGW